MTTSGWYIYGIVNNNLQPPIDLPGIGGQPLAAIGHKDISAIVSRSPITEYPVTRANTLTHQRVMEAAMATADILPVRFGTVAESADKIVKKVLTDRYDEIQMELKRVANKVELGLKAIWLDEQAVYQQIIAENKDIRTLRDRLIKKRGVRQREQMRLGEKVKHALEKKKQQVEKQILNPFQGLWCEHKRDRLFGDRMITNAVFLVDREKEARFDQAVEKLDQAMSDQIRFKYVGPAPPNNFVELVIN